MYTNIKLLEIESTFISKQMASITSITFFEGSFDLVQEEILQRFTQIVEKNPWLCGTLRQVKGKKCLNLQYVTAPTSKEIERLYVLNPHGLNIDKNMPYDVLVKTLRPSLVDNPPQLLKTKEPVSRLILLSNISQNPNAFALIFSLSHSVADGHTYYKIFNMLSHTVAITALHVHRKEEALTQAIETFGSKTYQYLKAVPHVINVLRGMFTGPRSKAYIYLIDEDKITALKRDNTSKHFISSNDIITSTFSNFISARLMLMAINFRDKTEGLREEDAGNYESAILYDKGIYTDPVAIRKSLDTRPYQGLTQKLPSFVEGMFCPMGLITNWSSFSLPLQMNHAKQTLHLPITNASGNAPYEMAVIFRPRAGQLGILYFAKNFSEEAFKTSQIPLGKKV